MSSKHVSVMLGEALDFLEAKKAGTYLDCTLGGGGHTRGILDANSENRVLAIDRDLDAINRAQEWSETYGDRLQTHHANFSAIAELCSGAKFNGILADLGTSVDQIEGERGFSFRRADPLDMRMDATSALTADEIVNKYSEQQIFVILKKGGVGSEARKIARAIVRSRPIKDTSELADLIASVSQASAKEAGKKRHAATLAFQALRIAVNNEFEEIENLLAAIPDLVQPKARLVMISFHSLEDKLVAQRMRHWEKPDSTPALWAVAESRERSKGRLLTRKALSPSEGEVAQNSKSRSARLRAFEFFTEV